MNWCGLPVFQYPNDVWLVTGIVVFFIFWFLPDERDMFSGCPNFMRRQIRFKFTALPPFSNPCPQNLWTTVQGAFHGTSLHPPLG